MMASETGRESEFAVQTASTWGTAVAAGAGDGALFLTETVTKAQEVLPDDSNQTWPVSSDLGAITVEGDIEMYLRYDDLAQHRMLCHAMGSAVSGTTAGGGYYTNTYGLKDTLDALFVTLAFNRVTDVQEIPTSKMDGFTMTGTAGEPIRITFHIIGDTENVNIASAGTNNPDSSWPSVTIVERENRVVFHQLSAWMNGSSAAPCSAASSNDIYPNGFTLTYRRNTAGDQTADGDNSIDEPMGGVPTIELSLEFPKHNAAARTNMTDFAAGNTKKLHLNFTNGTYYFYLEFPNLIITSTDSNIPGPDKIPHNVTFTALGRETAPNGMTGLLEPFQVRVSNTQTANPLT